ncbi:MAG: FAD-dependent oxidoreductase [Planctomycetota bacterium]|nr:FAD-dependent oxidoreductase [Planctomycetota bacterium]
MANVFSEVLSGTVALYKGMRVTLGYMFKQRFNVPYPEKKHPLPERFRGVLRIKDKIDSPTAPLTWQQAVDVTDKEGAMPPCMEACPDHQHARDYIRFISQRQFLLGLQISRLTMPYPGSMGRACARPCEQACRMGEEGESIAICQLKRFVADWGRENVPMEQWDPVVNKVKGAERYRIAIIGGGPAGMTAAHMLGRKGYGVTVFDNRAVLGGYFSVGIPQHRLPREIVDEENESVLRYGVEARLNCTVGKDIEFRDIYKEFDAVLLSTGATVPNSLGFEGEDMEGIYKGEYFLEKVCLGQPPKVGKKVIVIGLGLTAVDCARVARRLGGEIVKFSSQHTKKEAPAPEHEIADCEGEGIEVIELVNPVGFIGENGKLTALKLVKTKLGELDSSGRRRVIPLPGTEFTIPTDCVITAISRKCDYSYLPEDMDFTFRRNKTVKVDENYMTNVDGVFAAGDGVIGPWNLISAIAQGRFASGGVERYLDGKTPKKG